MKAVTVGTITVLEFANLKEAHTHGKNLSGMPVKFNARANPKRYYAAGGAKVTKKVCAAAIARAKELLEE